MTSAVSASREVDVKIASSLVTEPWPIDRVIPYARNPRKNSGAVAKVTASIREFGFRQPIVVDPDGVVIVGHTRLLAARQLGLSEVPVHVATNLTPAQVRAYRIMDNRSHEESEWDEELLPLELTDLRDEGFDLDLTGFDAKELASIFPPADAGGRDVEPQIDRAEELRAQWGVEPGQIWILGDHRILCGDSTSAADLARLMREEKAALLATDPPYLVDYQGGNHPQSWANTAETRDKHWDDYVDPKSGLAFFSGFLRVALAHCHERAPVYQWHATRRQALVEEAWRENGLLLHQSIIWVKARSVLTRSHFMWQHEPCFYGWREGFMPEKDRRPPPNATTVWNIDQKGEQDGIHPTQKPLEVFLRPIQYHTLPGEVVLEPFSGSGTMLVACENLGRRCRAVEISPAFVAVALQRWHELTGKTPELEREVGANG